MILDNNFSFNTIAGYTYKNRVPQSVTIELLTLCNLKCEHCYIPEHNNSGLDYLILKDLFKQLRKMGSLNLVLTGGEIFLRKDIITLVELARTLGFRVSLLSNSTMITDEQINQLSNLYIESFSTTIFSLNDEINDSITGVKGSLQMILNNIKKIKDKGIKVEIKTPLMKKNKYAYRDLQDYCNSHSFNYIPSLLITSKYNGDSSTYNLRIEGEDLFQINKEIGGLLNIEKDMLENIRKTKEICPSIRNSVYIDSAGDVFPCNSFLYKIGNIKQQSFIDIWLDSKELKYLTSLTKEDLKECKHCELNEFCTRCPGHALLEDGSIFACSSFDKKMAQLYIKQFQES